MLCDIIEQSNTTETSVGMEMVYIFTIQHGSHKSHVDTEPLKCG